jgi:predicted MFS family arabinose efflux permease
MQTDSVLSCRVRGSTGASWTSRTLELLASITLGVVGYGVYLGLPVILGSLTDSLHFLGARQIGWIASLELLGLTLGSVLTARILGERSSRWLAGGAISLGLLFNACTAFVHDFYLICALRLLAGVAGGACYSLSLASLAWFGETNRNAASLGVGFVLMGSVELAAIPWIDHHCGARGVFLTLALLYSIPASLMPFLARPQRGQPSSDHTVSQAGRARSLGSLGAIGAACLTAIAVFNLSSTMFWTYVEQLGQALGVATVWVAKSLTVANAVTLVSTWLALFLARRFGQHRPQILGLIGTVVLLASWHLSASPTDFAVRVFLWFQIQAICIVHQISLLGTLDGSGRLAALLPAAQGVGQCAGPLAGALLLTCGFGFRGQLLAQAAFYVIAAALFAAVAWFFRRVDQPQAL